MRLFALFAVLGGLTVPANAEWHKSDTRHFTIYSEGSEVALRAFAIKVERFDTLLRKRYAISDTDMPQKLTIFMLPTQAAVASIYGGKNRDIAGFYRPRGEGSIAVVHRKNGNSKYILDADAVLFHEYAHHFMIRNFPVAYPAWFIEGFAEFYGTTDFTKEGHAKLGMAAYYRAYGLLDKAPIPAEKLLTSSVSDFSSDQLDSFYGRSWLLVHYLNFTPTRVGQLSKYLKAINQGATGIDAARTAFGDLGQLDKELKIYLAKSSIGYIQQGVSTPAPERVDVAPVSPAVGATMMQRLALMHDPDKDDLPKLIGTLRASAAKYPDEADPQLLLAEAHYLADDDAAAVEAADAALKITPALSRAMLVKGKAIMRQNIKNGVADAARWKEARGWIVKANRADVNDPMPLFAYYRSFGQQGIEPLPSSLDGLRRAYEMVPEDHDVRMTYAFALATRKYYAAAIHLVETVAFDPHNGPGAAEARSILKRLQAARDGKDIGERDIFGDEMENKERK